MDKKLKKQRQDLETILEKTGDKSGENIEDKPGEKIEYQF